MKCELSRRKVECESGTWSAMVKAGLKGSRDKALEEAALTQAAWENASGDLAAWQAALKLATRNAAAARARWEEAHKKKALRENDFWQTACKTATWESLASEQVILAVDRENDTWEAACRAIAAATEPADLGPNLKVL